MSVAVRPRSFCFRYVSWYTSNMDLQTVIFIGRSGAGKGTQSKLLKDFLGEQTPEVPILYIETGAYFRKYIKEVGDTWNRARKLMDIGVRQPDFLAVWVWTTAFIENYRGNEHLIFDGAPRAIDEARVLETVFPFYERKNTTVVFINVSKSWAEARLAGRGRADDVKADVVARRLGFFEKDVMQVIDYYRTEASACRMVEINGEQTPDEVFGDIKKELGLL